MGIPSCQVRLVQRHIARVTFRREATRPLKIIVAGHAAAVAARAELVVSGDRDLLSIGSHQDIAIVSPAEALRRIATNPGRESP